MFARGEQTRSRREGVLKLSQTDRDRLVVLHQVVQGQLSVAEGARRAGLGARHFRRTALDAPPPRNPIHVLDYQ
jgi:hypothetical protein